MTRLRRAIGIVSPCPSGIVSQAPLNDGTNQAPAPGLDAQGVEYYVPNAPCPPPSGSGQELPRGVYSCRLFAGGCTATAKLRIGR